MMPHVQQCHHQLVGVSLGHPGHVFIDGPLDLVASLHQPATQAFDVAETEYALFRNQRIEVLFQHAEFCAQRLDVVATHVADGGFDDIEASVRLVLRLLENVDQCAVR